MRCLFCARVTFILLLSTHNLTIFGHRKVHSSDEEVSVSTDYPYRFYRRHLEQRTRNQASTLERVETVFDSRSCRWNSHVEECDVSTTSAADYYLQVQVPEDAVGADNLVDMAFSLTDCGMETDSDRCKRRPECSWFREICDSVLFRMPNECFGPAGDALRRNCTGIANQRACNRVTGCVYDRSKDMCSFDLTDFFQDIRNRPSSGSEEVPPVRVTFNNNTRNRLMQEEADCMETKNPRNSCSYPCFYDSDMSVCTLDKNYLVQSLRYRRNASEPNSCSLYDTVINGHPGARIEENDCLVQKDNNGPCQWNPSSHRCLPSPLSVLKSITTNRSLIRSFENTQEECNQITQKGECGGVDN